MKLSRLWKKKKPSPYGLFPWLGTWEEACRHTTGYDLALVGQNIATHYEGHLKRLESGPLFLDTRVDQDRRAEQLLAAMAVVFSRHQMKKIRVVDFGGASGLFYHLAQRALPEIEFDWLIVETPQMIEAHRAYVLPHLRWQKDLPSAPAEGAEKPFDFCLAFACLQYMEKPYEIVEKLAALGRYLIVNALPMTDSPEDRIVIQHINPGLHETSHPHWLFSERKFLDFLSRKGDLKLRWLCPHDAKRFEDHPVDCKGQLIELRPR